MIIMDTVRVALRGTGVPVAQAPGMNGRANEILSREGLTSSPDVDATIAAEPPSRRAAEPPSRRAAEPPSRRAAEPPSRLICVFMQPPRPLSLSI